MASHINWAHGLMDAGHIREAAPLIDELAGDEGALLRKLDTDAAGEIAFLHGWLLRSRGESAKAEEELTMRISAIVTGRFG